MLKIETYGFIKGGKLNFNRRRFDAELNAFPDCDVSIVIKKKGKRSLPQNAYYWSCVVKDVMIGLNQIGNRMDVEETHEFLKFHFNKQYIHNENGEVIGEYGGTTTALNKSEFSEYIEKIAEWSSQKLGVIIPPAGTQSEMFAA